jgi:hypothetical protein
MWFAILYRVYFECGKLHLRVGFDTEKVMKSCLARWRPWCIVHTTKLKNSKIEGFNVTIEAFNTMAKGLLMRHRGNYMEKCDTNSYFFCFNHQFNMFRGSVLASSDSRSLPVAVVGDRTVLLPIKFNVNHYWTD